MASPDYDGKDGLKLVQDCFKQSDDFQSSLNKQLKRDYRVFRAIVDMTYRDPTRANVIIPKVWSVVENKAPKHIKALFGQRPYCPFDVRKELKPFGDAMNELLDYYMNTPQFFAKAALAGKIKTVFGTAYIEAIPRLEVVTQNVLAPTYRMGTQVGVERAELVTRRLGFRYITYAGWEIFRDPMATGLEERGDCRYVIKYQIVSKREIARMAIEEQAFPGLDVERLFSRDWNQITEHKGMQILQSVGIYVPPGDTDLCVMVRYESPDRYITTLNNEIVLRDVPNPYKHKLINLSRWIHTQDAHTQNQFEGLGEAKTGEILQAVLSDNWNAYLNALAVTGQPVIAVNDKIDPKSVVWNIGSRVSIPGDANRPIREMLEVLTGPPLPPDHTNVIGMTERYADLAHGEHPPNRGEPSKSDNTLGETLLDKQAGDERQELSIKLGEQIFLSDHGKKMMYHLDQYSTVADWYEVLGLEKATFLQMIQTANPQNLPGGYSFTFRGSDKVVNQLVKQQKMEKLAVIDQGITNLPLYEEILGTYDLDESRRTSILQARAQQLMAQQMMAAATASAKMGKDEKNPSDAPRSEQDKAKSNYSGVNR